MAGGRAPLLPRWVFWSLFPFTCAFPSREGLLGLELENARPNCHRGLG